MLYLYHGPDTDNARKKIHTLIAGLLKKQPHAEHFRFEAEKVTSDRLSEYTQSQGLFANKYIVFLDQPFDAQESGDAVVAFRKEIADSENIFIVLAGSLTKTILKKFESTAEKIIEVGGTQKQKTTNKEFNIFTLTDALGNRAPGKLWTLYQRALHAGKSAEEVHGVLCWQIKSMLLASQSTDASSSGLKPFVYSKSKKHSNNFSEGELEKLSRDYVDVYHAARRGEISFEEGLEGLILST